MLFEPMLACVRGGGDLATGAAFRLFRAGLPVVVLELPEPRVIRRAVAFAEAVYRREIEVDRVTARLAQDAGGAAAMARSGLVAVLVDPDGRALDALRPVAIVDGRMLKRNPGDTRRDQAPLVVALGPGYTAGVDCHAVVETNRGHDLGRVIRHGPAEPNTGVPGRVAGRESERVLRAPAAGEIRGVVEIGETVSAGQLIATVGGEPLLAPLDGVLRGLTHDGLRVSAGAKIGDVDPRGVRRHCFTISDKALAVGGGVVEAVLSAPQLAGFILSTGW
jgi:xanthine dehydrogenase accessory factor